MRFTESDIDEMVFMAKKFGSYRRAAKELGFNHQSVIDHCHERGLHIPGPHEKCKQHMKKKIVDGFVFYWESKGYYRGSVNGERMTLSNYIYRKIFGTDKSKGLTIIFKDGDRENYSLDNVEFVTVSEFMRIRNQDEKVYEKNVKMLEDLRKKKQAARRRKALVKKSTLQTVLGYATPAGPGQPERQKRSRHKSRERCKERLLFYARNTAKDERRPQRHHKANESCNDSPARKRRYCS